MPVLAVGPTKTYKTIAAGVAAAADGDTIAVDGGKPYVNDYPLPIGKSLRFQAVGPRVVMSSTGNIPNGKGILICGKNDGTMPTISINGFDFQGAVVSSGNGAGIRYQSGYLTCSNCRFISSQDGILATPWTNNTGTIVLDHCELANNGKGDGQTHNCYFNHLESVTISNCYIHDAKIGHQIKSRSLTLNVSNTRVYDNAGDSSYSIDYPDCGNLNVTNCTIQQGKNGANNFLFTYGVGSTSNPGRTCNFSNCVIVNDRAGAVYLMYNNVAGVTATFTNCSFFGIPNTVAARGKGSVSLLNPTWLPTRPTLDTKAPYQSQFPPPAAGTMEADEDADEADLPEPLPEQEAEQSVPDEC